MEKNHPRTRTHQVGYPTGIEYPYLNCHLYCTLDNEKAVTIISLLVDRTAEEVLMGLTRCA
jgi:hypothetical protein